jgi:hypothetical protein
MAGCGLSVLVVRLRLPPNEPEVPSNKKARHLASSSVISIDYEGRPSPANLKAVRTFKYAQIGDLSRKLALNNMAGKFTPQEISDFEAVLSPPRFATYLRETGGDRERALVLIFIENWL